MADLEKTPLQSKKFIAFFASLAVIASVLTIALFTQTFGWPMVMFMCIGIIGICFLGIGYVLNQSALDKFVRGIRGLSNGKSDDTE